MSNPPPVWHEITREERRSADGYLLFVTRPGVRTDYRGTYHGTFVAIHEADKGVCIADFSATERSAVRWRADGMALLDIGWGPSNTVLIVEGRRFRVVGGEWEPIDGLLARIAAEQQAVRDGYDEVAISPDGRIRIAYTMNEWRMSHWTRSPSITDLETGEHLFSMGDSMWDGTETWRDDGTFELSLRHYQRGGGATLRFDPAARTVALASRAEATHPITEGRQLVEAEFARIKRDSRKIAAQSAGRGSLGSRILIALGLFLVVGAGIAVIVLWERSRPSAPAQPLREVPKMTPLKPTPSYRPDR